MGFRKRSERGLADIAMAVGLVTIAAVAAYFSSVSTKQQQTARLNIVNGAEGFYAGEMAAISALFRNAVTALPDGRTPINTFSNTSGALDKKYQPPSPPSLIARSDHRSRVLNGVAARGEGH